MSLSSPHVQITSDGRINIHRSSLKNAVEKRYLANPATLSRHYAKLGNYFSSQKKNPAARSSSLFTSVRNLEEFLHAKVGGGEVGGGGMERCWEVLCECENFFLLKGALFVRLWGKAGKLVR